MHISKRNVVLLLFAIGLLLIPTFLFLRPNPVVDSDIESKLVIDQCYKTESCSSSKLISVSMIEKRGDDRLVEAVLQRGNIVDPDNDNFTVKWDQRHTTYALCSKDKPRIAFEHNSGFVAEEFDLTNVPGVSVDNSSLYLGICHGTLLNQVRNNPMQYGYQSKPDGGRGQFNISEPSDLFQ